MTAEEKEYAVLEYQLLSLKPALYVLNVSEEDLEAESAPLVEIRESLARQGRESVLICGEMEAQLLDLAPQERGEYLKQFSLAERGMNRLIRQVYHLLGLMTFLTVGEDEVRAWTITQGTKAAAAAGKIHSDIERGFIRAEVMSCPDLLSLRSAAACREKGLLRLEGKEYRIQDGDVINFRFNV